MLRMSMLTVVLMLSQVATAGDTAPTTDEISKLISRIEQLEKRIQELERPTIKPPIPQASAHNPGVPYQTSSPFSGVASFKSITVDGNPVVSVTSKGVRITARSLTIEDPASQFITQFSASSEGLVSKCNNTSFTCDAFEMQTQVTITKMDLIRLEIIPTEPNIQVISH